MDLTRNQASDVILPCGRRGQIAQDSKNKCITTISIYNLHERRVMVWTTAK